MNDLIHNTLKSAHKLRWIKIRILANLDKDCIIKQLITNLHNFYPIFNYYYSFAFNDDKDFEVVVTITSINQMNDNNNLFPDAEDNIITISADNDTRLLTTSDITVDNNRNIVSYSSGDNNDDDDREKKATIVVTSPTIAELNDYDDTLPIQFEFQDFDTLPGPHPPTESWSTIKSNIKRRIAQSSNTRPTNTTPSSQNHYNCFETLRDDTVDQ